MRYPLATLAKSARPRTKSIAIREIILPSMLASDLYTRCYDPIIRAWVSRVPAIMAAYERAVSVRDGVIRDSAEDVRQAIEETGEYVSRLMLSLTPALRDWTVRVEQAHRVKWRSSVLSASGVDLQTILMAGPAPASVADTLGWNTDLIRDVSDQIRQRVGNAVFAGLNARSPARDVARAINEATGLGRDRSRRIAADQLQKMAGALDTERMADAGIETFRYRHSGKLHPRSTHKARDGKLYDLATFKEIGGSDEIKAGDRPSQPPWCGCRKQAVLSLD